MLNGKIRYKKMSPEENCPMKRGYSILVIFIFLYCFHYILQVNNSSCVQWITLL